MSRPSLFLLTQFLLLGQFVHVGMCQEGSYSLSSCQQGKGRTKGKKMKISQSVKRGNDTQQLTATDRHATTTVSQSISIYVADKKTLLTDRLSSRNCSRNNNNSRRKTAGKLKEISMQIGERTSSRDFHHSPRWWWEWKCQVCGLKRCVCVWTMKKWWRGDLTLGKRKKYVSFKCCMVFVRDSWNNFLVKTQWGDELHLTDHKSL